MLLLLLLLLLAVTDRWDVPGLDSDGARDAEAERAREDAEAVVAAVCGRRAVPLLLAVDAPKAKPSDAGKATRSPPLPWLGAELRCCTCACCGCCGCLPRCRCDDGGAAGVRRALAETARCMSPGFDHACSPPCSSASAAEPPCEADPSASIAVSLRVKRELRCGCGCGCG